MTVSVVIASFNASSFVTRAVASALAQTLQPVEVIVIDDASTDDSADVLRALAKSDARVKPIFLPTNRGPSAARNCGFASATGEWVAVLDADDAFRPERLERLCALGEERKADVVADDLLLYDVAAGTITGRALSPTPKNPFEIDLHAFLSANAVEQKGLDWGLLKPVLRTSFLRRTGVLYRTEQRHGEDFRFVSELLICGARYICSSDAYYLYTMRTGMLSGEPSGMSRTRLDYGAQAVDAQRLLADPRLIHDNTARGLLRARAQRMQRIATRHAISGTMERNEFGRLIWEALRRPANLGAVLTVVTRALARRLRNRVRRRIDREV